jgi:hypothetical protein
MFSGDTGGDAMRRMMTCVLVAALAAGALSACVPAPNEDAIEAAAEYSDALTEWTQELSAAAESARTATDAEWEAAGEGGELGFEEVGIGDVLTTAPELEAFDDGAVANTPAYLTAARVADQVEAITVELAGLEPESLTSLRTATFDSYWVLADLYYNTLGGPAADRVAAGTEAFDFTDDLPTFYRMLREAGLAFAEGRLELLHVAIEEMGGTALGSDRVIVPDGALGESVAAFIDSWLNEEVAFQEDAIEVIGGWSAVASPYDSFWNYGNLNGVFSAPARYAAELRPAFVAQAADLASALAEMDGDPSSAPALPALGDPYRQALLGGYLPWGDPAQTQDSTADRLWMVWRIQELDEVPEAAYLAARAAVLEEFNRSLAEDEAIDFRPGSGRLLTFVGEQSEWLSTNEDVEGYEEMHAALVDLQGYGEALGRYPMTPEVAADFDTVLELSATLIADIEAVMERGTSAYSAISGLVSDYLKAVEDAASGSLGALDDDAQAEQLTAAAIEATAPGAGSGSESSSP